jgi:hypothetical protein
MMTPARQIQFWLVALCVLLLSTANGATSGKANALWPEEFNGPYNSWLNVKDFGAVGDGKHDDTASLEKALASLVGQDRKGVLYFPAGAYLISRTLEFASLNPELNPPGGKSRAALGKAIVGQHPATTVLVWGGKAGGTMLHLAGQSNCRYGRLTFDGRGKARICLRVERMPELYRNSSYVQIHDMIFRDSDFGIYNTDVDHKHDMDAEYSILRCRFSRISDTAIRIDAGNAYDFWIRHCQFDDCTRGVMNTWGDFYVMQSNFRRSKDCDVIAYKHRSGSVRGCYSENSRQFLRISKGRFSVQDNTIVGTTGETAISFERNAPYESVLILDNKIISDKPGGTPLIKVDSGQLETPVAVIGNALTVSDSLQLNNQNSILIDNRLAEKTLSVRESEMALPATPPQVKRKVFDAQDCAELQTKIDEAVAYFARNPDSRPVIHLEASEAKMDGTLVFPAGVPLKLVGDAGRSCIRGKKRTVAAPTILLRGPSLVRIRDIEFQYGGRDEKGRPASSVADILIDNSDQENSRVTIGNSWISGLFADRLRHTKIDLLDLYCASYGPFLRTTLKVVGAPEGANVSRVAMFGGVAVGDQIFAHVLDGGRLLMQDFWHEENGPMTYPWALLSGNIAGKGTFILQNASIYQQSKEPIVEINDFRGEFTAVSNLILGHSQKIRCPQPDPEFSLLSLFGCLQLGEHSHAPRNFLLIDKVSPNSQVVEPQFIRKHLAALRRWKAPRLVRPAPKGATDVRLQRVTARYQNGWGVWVKPEKHVLRPVGVCVEASDSDAAEGGADSGEFLFSRDSSQGELTVSYQIVGSIDEHDLHNPLSGCITFPDKADTVRLKILPRDDEQVEPLESLKVTILPQESYAVGTNRQSTRDSILLQDNDRPSEVRIDALDNQASETNHPLALDTAKIRFWRSATQGDLTVTYKLVGNPLADKFKDEPSGQIVIPDGRHEVILELQPLNDDCFEPSKSVRIVLQASPTYTIKPPGAAEITILDDDILALKLSQQADRYWLTRNGDSGALEVPGTWIFTPANKTGTETKKAVLAFKDGERQLSFFSPFSEQLGDCRLRLAPIPGSTMDDVVLPEIASRYCWLVSKNKLVAIDLALSQWGSRGQPGEPMVSKSIAVPDSVKQSGKWIGADTPDQSVSLAFDPVDKTLWVMRMAEKGTPQTLWKIEHLFGEPTFAIWAVGAEWASGTAPVLRLCPNRDLATGFYANHYFAGFVSKDVPLGELPETRPGPSIRPPVFISPTCIVASRNGKCYQWADPADLSLQKGRLLGAVSGVGDAISPIPQRTSQLLGLDHAVLLATRFPAFTIYSKSGTDAYGAGSEGFATKVWWDPHGRLWLRPHSWQKSAVVLDPLNKFRQVMEVPDLNQEKMLVFDNTYAYLLGTPKKFIIARMLLNGRGPREYLSLETIGTQEGLKCSSKGDPTGCHWYILSK